jgi:signal transduction histidine kinase
VVPQEDGPHTYVSVKFPLCNPDGSIYALCGISTDITESHRAAAALRESQAKLAGVIESSPDPIFAIDREYRLVAFNSVLVALFAELFRTVPRLGESLRAHIPPARTEYWYMMLDRALAGERLSVERAIPFGDALRQFVVALNPTVMDGRITGVTAFIREVTSLRRAEDAARRHQAELAHALRTQTMGEVAANLAHEINQPLGAIANYAQGCRHRLEAGTIDRTELLQVVDEIAREALRAGAITRRVRRLLRKDEPQRALGDVNQIVAAALDIVAPAAQDRAVRLRFRPGAYLPAVSVDRIQIEQVLLNLVLNSIDAVEAGGSAREVDVASSVAGESGVEVAVRDHGIGLDPQRLEQVFEPFMTTKPTGLGMGLAISRSIIQAHGGRLWAAANPDGGATFRFVLPAAAAADEPTPA